MDKKNILISIIFLFLCIIVVLSGSIFFTSKFRYKSLEEKTTINKIIIKSNMTISEILKNNHIPEKVILKALQVNKNNTDKTLNQLNINTDIAEKKIIKTYALYKEETSKNWFKIRIKFFLWFLYLVIIFILIKIIKINKSLRIFLYAISVLIFGIMLGSDPSPMGTVKDAIFLFGKYNTIFIPRIIALLLFLIIGVVIANKFICSWGCQFGTLQDLIHRIFRTKFDTKGIINQIKLPFWFNNSIRIITLFSLIISSFIFGYDLLNDTDPFKIYNPLMLGITGIISISLIIISSIFIYRPFCHFICPFGLIGWLFEKISIFKIAVNYNTCIACEACSKACPSNVMNSILKREDKVIPDCFSCGTCISICPTNSISFKAFKRKKPFKNKFSINKKED